jgi:hypothetical protein
VHAQEHQLPRSFLIEDSLTKAAFRSSTLRIELQRSEFHRGDSIDVRVTLINNTDRTIPVPGTAAPNLVNLQVSDAAGLKLQSSFRPGVFLMLSVQTLGPNGELTLYSAEGREWINLRDWGYDVREAGTYTIAGSPRTGGPNRQAEASTMLASKEVSFTITQ